jgi:8-oxo-dGTP pyrophosphatase MutT (NUDIX family)
MIRFEHIRQALALSAFDGRKAQQKMAHARRLGLQPDPAKPPRQSAVLVLIHPLADDRLAVILTRRTDHLRGHSGQVSFPGGSCDPDDLSHEMTALRETCEEIGICDGVQIEIVGKLTTIWIPPSNFEVHPVVALLDHAPALQPNPEEVDSVLHLGLDDLLSATIKQTTVMEFRGTAMDVPYYDVSGHIVWGATAGMLSELEERLRFVLSQAPHP